ncbi:MAG: rRNA maturation RNase YbeY [Lachnospiraceae bacterium]|nr:rRNA maturation RNase YbeY [Lachnospiraceae bacterium]
MTLLFEKERECDLSFDPEKEAIRVLEGALTALEFPYETQIGLTLTDGPGIREANREFRDTDRETDVLSFPMVDLPGPGDFSDEEAFSLSTDPDTGEVVLGDILINTDRVISQAREFGHSVFREYAFLLVHSLLHLCGFDHETEAEEKEMFQKQDEILNRLEIYR